MRTLVLVAPHTRELDTVLGTLRASLLYDAYAERIANAGGEPFIAWPGTTRMRELLDHSHAVLLIGGGDIEPGRFDSGRSGEAVDRRRDEFEAQLVLASREQRKPLLGICRGAQMLNVALGGTLTPVDEHRQEVDLPRPWHRVALDLGSRLWEIVASDELMVNSFHRWAPDRIGRGLRVSGRSPDGAIEALESDDEWWAVGVQWHAELLAETSSQRLFDGFVRAIEREVSDGASVPSSS
jgi:putative glutamine amidotransferase